MGTLLPITIIAGMCGCSNDTFNLSQNEASLPEDVGHHETTRLAATGFIRNGENHLQLASSTFPRQGEHALTVFAASSLQNVLPKIVKIWTEAGGIPVRVSFDATSRLAGQISRGMPADVVIAADEHWMWWLGNKGKLNPKLIGTLATNQLAFVAPLGFPSPPQRAEDIHSKNLSRIVIADENVPAGRYAKATLEAANLWGALEDQIVRGGSVRGALEWVSRGEADGGFVYQTDAMAEEKVKIAFVFPPEESIRIVYTGAAILGSQRFHEAAMFLKFLESPVAQAVFTRAGFGAPEATTYGPDDTMITKEEFVPDPWSAIQLSLVVALGAMILGLIPAIAVGWTLARYQFFGKSFISMLFMTPLVMPPVVTGFLLLDVLGRQSFLGRTLDALGLPVPFTILGAMIAALVVGFPLYVMAIRGAFEMADRRFEEVSWTLGVSRTWTFWRISLPLALPGIVAGAVLTFARALGEFGATIVLAGNLEGETRTIALAVYSLLESPSGQGATWMLVSASVAISLIALLGFESLSRWQRKRLES
tara:strand:+ start:1219 stop:2829 length:1611 start_codon:yes stop_codon:yes gene_type:complete